MPLCRRVGQAFPQSIIAVLEIRSSDSNIECGEQIGVRYGNEATVNASDDACSIDLVAANDV